MFNANLLASGMLMGAAVAVTLTGTPAKAEPYGGFAAVERKYIRIDYGPRYQATENVIKYVDTPAYVGYRHTYTGPVARRTRVVYDSPVAEYVAPIRYRRVYAPPRRVLPVSPVVRFGGFYHRPHARHYHHRPHGILRHFRPHRYFRPYGYGYHPRSWGFSIGGGRGYYGGYGGFSFHYRH